MSLYHNTHYPHTHWRITRHSPIRIDRCRAFVDINNTTQSRTARKHTSAFIWIYSGQIATFQGKRRYQAQHIAQICHSGELPVRAIAHAADCPDDERLPQTWSERNTDEGRAFSERPVAHIV